MEIPLEEFRKLPIEERLRIVEHLCDDIGASREPFPVREWHVAETRNRAAEMGSKPGIALTRDELWRRVEGADA